MVEKRKTRPKKIRFELSWGAIAGVGVVVFCLFLWMFLLGVWTGQSLLRPAVVDQEIAAAGKTVKEPTLLRAERKVIKTGDSPGRAEE
jgi:hypothetical protein